MARRAWTFLVNGVEMYRVGQKMAQLVYVEFLTLSNINRFSKFFHCRNQEKICNSIITKDPTTTPQVCRYCEMSASHSFDWLVKIGEDWHRLRRAGSRS